MAAVRYVFGYRGEELWLVQRQWVDTMAPLSGALDSLAERAGFWCELRDAGGAPVYRQAMRDPRHPTDEVPGGQRHVTMPRQPAGVFTVVVPDLPEATTIAVLQRRSTDSGPVDVLVVELA